jgi:hypothetical protein
MYMFHLLRIQFHVPIARWKQELQPTSLAAMRMTLTIYHGIPLIQNYFARRVRRTEGLCSGTHDVSFTCIVCIANNPYRTQESRHTQQIVLKVSPVQTNYSPDGRALIFTSAGHQLFFLTYGKDGDGAKEQWHQSDKDGVRSTFSGPWTE